MTSDPPSAAHVARRAEELRIIFLGLNMAVIAMSLPSHPLLRAVNEACGNFGTPVDQPIVVGDESLGLEEKFSALEVLHKLVNLSGDSRVEDVMHVAMMQGAIRMGALIHTGRFRDPNDPLLEFTRHFRNACAHNGKWHFRNGEPRNPAELQGHSLEASMHGAQALWSWVTPFLYMQRLADLRDYFAELANARSEDPEAVASTPPNISISTRRAPS